MCDILLVEDDDLIRETLAEYLRDEGHCVFEAENDVQALQTMRRSPAPPVLVTDLHLAASKDGIYVAHAAREMSPLVKIIFITGRPDALADHVFHDNDKLLAKPFRPMQLLNVIQQMHPQP